MLTHHLFEHFKKLYREIPKFQDCGATISGGRPYEASLATSPIDQ